MKNFLALVHKEPDSSYGVTFPDLPGCFSAADNFDDLTRNACEALELWFEDAEPVEPSTFEAMSERVDADLKAGAFLVSVPLVSAETKPVRVNISLERGILNAIDAAAGQRKLTRSAFLAEAARNEICGAH